MTSQDSNNKQLPRFRHHGLDVYEVALQVLVGADRIAKELPRGYGPLADQLRRATQAVFLQLAEAVARSGADRSQRLRIANAEASEAAACVEGLLRLGLVSEQQARALLELLHRVCGMLTKLASARF